MSPPATAARRLPPDVPHRRSRAGGSTSLRLATVVIVGWGAFAFGAVYPWAYAPLLIACAAVGIAGLALGRNAVPVGLAIGLGLVALGAMVQLVPLPRAALETVSPAGHRFLAEYDLGYAFGGRGQLSIRPQATVLGLAFVAAYGLLTLGLARLLTRSSARTAAGAVVIVGYALGLFGVMNRALFTGRIYGFWEPLMGGTPFGPFVNRNHFAGWMVMAMPLALGLFLAQVSAGMRDVEGGLRGRLLWFGSPEAGRTVLVGFGILIMALSLVLTLSRSGMIAAAISLLVTLLVATVRPLGRWRFALVFVFLMATVMLVAEMAGTERIQGRFAGANPQTIGGRLPIWADTVQIASAFFPFGSGLNTFGIATLMYQRSMPGLHLAEAHNDYLQLAAEGGLLLGVPIVITIVAFMRRLRARFRESDEASYWLRVGAVTGMGAVAIQSLVEFSLQMPGNAVFAVVLLALALHQTPAHRRTLAE
jgi:O-antigen ligase